jgi:diguanylate cyclase (GGDEF)-like protein
MKRLLPVLAIVFWCAAPAWAAAQGSLTSLRAIHALSNEQASHSLPVAFEATVSYFRGYERTLFVQDGDVAIFVLATTNGKLVPGDRILVKGTTHESFRPFIVSSDITLLGHGPAPTPVLAGFNDLIHAQLDCRLVTVRATVRAADIIYTADRHVMQLQMALPNGNIDAVVDSEDATSLENLLDAEVEVTGAVSGRFDGKMQETGILLHVTSLADVKLVKHAGANPWALPVTPMDEIFSSIRVSNATQRVRVKGTVTYYQPSSAAVLQDGNKSLWIMTQTHIPLHIGDQADATGFPDVHDGFLTLTRGEIQDTHQQNPVEPRRTTWHELAMSRNIFDLVSVEGQVLMEVREASQDEYVLLSEGQLFSAIYRHPPAASLASAPLPPMKKVPLGAKVRVTGICILEDSNPFDAQVPFNLLIRSFDDIAVVAAPTLLNVRNLTMIVALLLVVVFAVGTRSWILERKVRRQTAALAARVEAEAALERRRSRILEDINGTRPLAEVLEQIVEMVSFMLLGAPCWCEIAEGARLGACPAQRDGLRVLDKEIPARSGPALGRIFAGFHLEGPSAANRIEALSVGAGLAALAIETRRVYCDLVHRSEFDLLTDTHNRFSLETLLDAQIAQARETAGIFGLVYIDLDKFKQINDLYGHRTGDLYLQEVTARMKHQLRAGDRLARLGGDEFAALVPAVHSRSEVEEIAQRLEQCYRAPFVVEGVALQGSASVGIALYPENGSTKDSLLSAADAAMYEAKHGKLQTEPVAPSRGPE